MNRRARGEGSWSKVNIRNTEYFMFRININDKRKSFYGKTKKQALEKYKKFIETPVPQTNNIPQTFYEYTHNWLFTYKKEKVKIRTFDYYDYIIESFIKDSTLGN